MMTCNGNTCGFDGEPIPTYSWGSTNMLVNYTCRVHAKYITAHTEDDNLWDTECKAKDLRCGLNNGVMVIWNASIIHTCPYIYVGHEIAEKAYLYSPNTILMKSKGWLFQVTEEVKDCGGYSLFKTAEGLYLSVDRPRNITKTELDDYASQDLTLADMGFNNFKAMAALVKLSYQTCRRLTTVLSLFRSQEDTLLITYDNSNRKWVLYCSKNMIFVAMCTSVKEVKLVARTDHCYKDVSVDCIVGGNSKSKKGFLTKDGIIKAYSEIVPCTGINKIFICTKK